MKSNTSLNASSNTSKFKQRIITIITLVGSIPILAILGLLLLTKTNDQTKLCSDNNLINTGLSTTTAIFNTSQGKVAFDLEIADNQETRSIGLMCRSSLESRSGMLFVFDQQQPLSFWMKNTFVSLDIIFLDENKKILNIYSQTLPDNQQITYPSKGNAMYVIELKASSATKYNIAVDQKVTW